MIAKSLRVVFSLFLAFSVSAPVFSQENIHLVLSSVSEIHVRGQGSVYHFNDTTLNFKQVPEVYLNGMGYCPGTGTISFFSSAPKVTILNHQFGEKIGTIEANGEIKPLSDQYEFYEESQYFKYSDENWNKKESFFQSAIQAGKAEGIDLVFHPSTIERDCYLKSQAKDLDNIPSNLQYVKVSVLLDYPNDTSLATFPFKVKMAVFESRGMSDEPKKATEGLPRAKEFVGKFVKELMR